MVIDIINILRAVIVTENHTPVGAYCNGPKPFPLAFQRMQPESRQVYVGNRRCGMKRRQNIPQFAYMIRANSAWVVPFKEPFQPLVADCKNHPAL